MGFYERRIVPHLLTVACGAKPIRPLRARACAGLAGKVIEVGFGSGMNVPYYPAAVKSVTAVDPSDLGWRLAGKRVARTEVPIERAGLDGEHLPFHDNAFDTALTTFTMCTIPDALVALEELRRVLRPGGTLHFLEHGLAPDEKVRRWQHRLDPLEQRLFAGCTFTRPIASLIADAGFTITALDVFYGEGGPKFATASSLGVATA